ncbi:MAG: phosphotransferase [Pseudomonadota bacterium]
MKKKELAKLIGYSIVQATRVLFDRIGDLIGNSLPFLPAKALELPRLNELLGHHSVPGNDAEPNEIRLPLSAIKVRDVKSISSNCQNLILDVQQAGSRDSAEPGENSVFLKLPMNSLPTHWFFALIGSWQLESYFCRHIAPRIPFRTPITFATYAKGTRFFIAQENLLDDPMVTLFTNLDMQQGPSLDLVHQCLDTFAQLHASHFDLSADQREQILPLKYHPFLGRQTGRVSQALNTYALKPCIKKAPGRIPKPIEDAYVKSLQHWEELLEYWFSGSLTLLHGDSHLGNFFVSGDDMGMLDFQAVHWGRGTRDVQYFLTDSLPVEVLADNERDLIKYYVERRAHHGAPIDFDDCWYEYRGFAYHSLMTIVVSIGFGALNEEQDNLMLELLDRSVAAAERLDYPRWLDSFLEANLHDK